MGRGVVINLKMLNFRNEVKFKGEVKEDENFELRMGGEEREKKIEGGK